MLWWVGPYCDSITGSLSVFQAGSAETGSDSLRAPLAVLDKEHAVSEAEH